MRYNLIYADPPWQYRDRANAGRRGACHKYPVMSLEAIQALPVASIAADDCLLAMWWTGPMNREALTVVDAWGFEVKNALGIVWHKTTKHGKDAFGMGHYTRGAVECCLFAVRGHPKRINASIRNVLVSPVGRHSEKPADARQLLVRLMGDIPRIELFARQITPGWSAWGNEIESTFAWPFTCANRY